MGDIDVSDWAALYERHRFPEVGRLTLSDIDQVLERHTGQLVYLATPYSKLAVHPVSGAFCPIRSDQCAFEAAKWVAMLAANRVTAISPIVMAVEACNADLGDCLDPLDATMWEDWCAPLLAASKAVVVPPIEGWQDSVGVWHEVGVMLNRGRAVHLLADHLGAV